MYTWANKIRQHSEFSLETQVPHYMSLKMLRLQGNY